jgi:hypothetical protein
MRAVMYGTWVANGSSREAVDGNDVFRVSGDKNFESSFQFRPSIAVELEVEPQLSKK